MRMRLRPAMKIVVLLAAAGGLVPGCAAPDDELDGEAQSAATSVPGAHLAGISDTNFNAARDNFNQTEDIGDGLGPVFNGASCGECHSLGASGGSGEQIERRFGRFVNGQFDPLANKGGSLRQLKSLGSFTGANGQSCTGPVEVEPAEATVHNVGRLTTPLFGLGLVDAMPDSAFANIANFQPIAIRGVANNASIILPNPDGSQNVGGTRLGRFGWKGGVPTLTQFAADAYMNEMGITTQHCIKGQSVTAFATESAPNGVPQPAGC